MEQNEENADSTMPESVMTTRTPNDFFVHKTCDLSQAKCARVQCDTNTRKMCVLCASGGMCCSHEERVAVATRHTKGEVLCTCRWSWSVLSQWGYITCSVRNYEKQPNRQETGHSQSTPDRPHPKRLPKYIPTDERQYYQQSPPSTGSQCRKPAMPKETPGPGTLVPIYKSVKLRIFTNMNHGRMSAFPEEMSISISSPQKRQETISIRTRSRQNPFQTPQPKYTLRSPLSSPRMRDESKTLRELLMSRKWQPKKPSP